VLNIVPKASANKQITSIDISGVLKDFPAQNLIKALQGIIFRIKWIIFPYN
jgi:hypothetical protein